jgi:hypothetical protein
MPNTAFIIYEINQFNSNYKILGVTDNLNVARKYQLQHPNSLVSKAFPIITENCLNKSNGFSFGFDSFYNFSGSSNQLSDD